MSATPVVAAPFTGVTRPGRRITPLPVCCGIVLLADLVLVLFGAWITPHDPAGQDPALSVTGPGAGHLLGTDQLGRDAFSQLIAGARPAIIGPVTVAVGCLLIGCALGLAAAYFGGVVDAIINRIADLIYSLPGLLIAIVVVGVLGGGYWLTAAVLLVLGLPYEVRLCRSAALVQVRLPYVDAARTLGLSSRRIMLRHVLPNIMPTVVATFLLDFVAALIGFTSLSYLGLGVPPGTPDWGRMLADGQALIALNPWLSLAPAFLLIVTAASATLLGDWVHERLTESGTTA